MTKISIAKHLESLKKDIKFLTENNLYFSLFCTFSLPNIFYTFNLI